MKKEFLMTGSLLLFAAGCGAADSVEPTTDINDIARITPTLTETPILPPPPTKTEVKPTPSKTPTKVAPTRKPTPRPTVRPPATPTAVEINPQSLNLPQIKPNGPAEGYYPWKYETKPEGPWMVMGSFKGVKMEGDNTIVVAIDITEDNIDNFQEFRMVISAQNPFKLREGMTRNKENYYVPVVVWQTSSPREAYAAIKHYGRRDDFTGIDFNGPMEDWLREPLKSYYQGYLMGF